MSDEFGVDADKLMTIVDKMAQVDGRVEAMISDADSQVAGLHATWVGEAAAIQADAHRRWSQGAHEMRDALAKLRAAALTAHGNHRCRREQYGDVVEVSRPATR